MNCPSCPPVPLDPLTCTFSSEHGDRPPTLLSPLSPSLIETFSRRPPKENPR